MGQAGLTASPGAWGRSPAAWLATTCLISWALVVAAAWPGWMSPDTLFMFAQARGGQVEDWHSPALTWLWSWLAPGAIGPVGPFLLQVSVFMGGVYLLGLAILRLGVRHAWALVPVLFLFESVWVIGWVWKDSATVALCSLAVGAGCLASTERRRRWHSVLLGTTAVALGLGIACRWYMAPALILLAVALVLQTPGPRRRQLWVALATPVLSAAVAAGALVVTEAAISPRKTYGSAQTMLLDIARSVCGSGVRAEEMTGAAARPTGVTASPGALSAFPPSLLHLKPGRDLCEDFSPIEYYVLMGYTAFPPDRSFYSIPTNDDQMSDLREAWFRTLRNDPLPAIAGRVQTGLRFLQNDLGFTWSPVRQLDTNVGFRRDVGNGATAGWASSNGPVLLALSSVTAFSTTILGSLGTTRLGLLSIVLLPAAAAAVLLVVRRRRRVSLRPLLLLGFPCLWLVNFAAFAPGTDLRFMMPAIIVGQLSTAWLLASALVAQRRASAPTNQGSKGPHAIP